MYQIFNKFKKLIFYYNNDRKEYYTVHNSSH